MYRLVFGNKFLHSAKKLDENLKFKLRSSLDILLKNPFHSTLHTKPLMGKLSHYYSLRIGRNYRVIFKLVSADIIYLIDIVDRKDI